MKFDYDAFGQRIAKHIYSIGTTPIWEESTYYVRDAQGNVMGTYRLKYENGGLGFTPFLSYKVTERPIYGSSRVGLNGINKELVIYEVFLGQPPFAPTTYPPIRKKLYELSNHLGNVLSVVSDAKFPTKSLFNFDFESGPLTVFNTTCENGWFVDAGASILVPTTVGNDRLNVQTNTQFLGAHYSFPLSSGVGYTLKFDLEVVSGTVLIEIKSCDGITTYASLNNANTGTNQLLIFNPTASSCRIKFQAGTSVATSFFVDNVSLSSSTAIYAYNADVVSYSDFMPFGSTMTGRTFSSEKYRFGFNGQEKTDEISGAGNHNTAEFWEYNPRLGRRWNLDPIVKPWESSYAALGNNPVHYSDPFGLDVINGHKADREKAKEKRDSAKKKFTGMKKGDEGYKDAKKAFKKADNEFNNVDAKFQRVENKINEIKNKDEDLFNAADKLTDAGGTKVDIYVYDTDHDILQVGVRADGIKYGDTDGKSGFVVITTDGSKQIYESIKSVKNGDNTITVRISDIAKAIHLAHEFGHGIYQAKYMKQYTEWLEANPKEQKKGGHGKNDPSGKAAEDTEKKFK